MLCTLQKCEKQVWSYSFLLNDTSPVRTHINCEVFALNLTELWVKMCFHVKYLILLVYLDGGC